MAIMHLLALSHSKMLVSNFVFSLKFTTTNVFSLKFTTTNVHCETASLICNDRTQSNPESTVGVLSMASQNEGYDIYSDFLCSVVVE